MMRLYTLLGLSLFVGHTTFAQSYNELEVNQVRARFHAHGLIGADPATDSPNFEVPVGGGAHALYAAGLWISGLTADNQLHLAAMQYETTLEGDYAPGPLTNDGTASIDQATSQQYDHVWSASASDIDLQQAYCTCLNTPGCDPAVEFPGYQMPASFNTWPGIGDVGQQQDLFLAPFIDWDGDLNYQPSNCDAPCIQGDRMLYSIFNDKLQPHMHSGCQPIGLQIQAMPFAYSGVNPALDHTVFVRYVIKNQSTEALFNTRIALFTDPDLGNYNDDYIGTDPARNLWYVYNADNNDESAGGYVGYGAQPPAFGTVVLMGPKLDPNNADAEDPNALPQWNGSAFGDGILDNERGGLDRVTYMLSSGVVAMSDPVSCPNFQGYMTGFWLDGQPVVYGGNGYAPNDTDAVPARYVFPGDTDPLGIGTGGVAQAPWSEVSAGNVPSDRRALGVLSPFTMEPGTEQTIVVAFVYARATSGGAQASIAALQARVDSLHGLITEETFTECSGASSILGVSERAAARPLQVAPVPADEQLTIQAPAELTGRVAEMRDATGRSVLRVRLQAGANAVDLSMLEAGMYTCEVRTERSLYSARLVKR